MKKGYSLVLFGLLLCTSLRVFASHVTRHNRLRSLR
jgi:hypothetical protein